MSEAPERSSSEGDNLRQSSIEAARNTGYKDISSFLYYRLSWQRFDRDLELEDFHPALNPEMALFNNFVRLAGEEGHLWTEDENIKSKKIMAAYISVTFPELTEASDPFLISLFDITNRYFEGKPEITLEQDEMVALDNILSRVGKSIEPGKILYEIPEMP